MGSVNSSKAVSNTLHHDLDISSSEIEVKKPLLSISKRISSLSVPDEDLTASALNLKSIISINPYEIENFENTSNLHIAETGLKESHLDEIFKGLSQEKKEILEKEVDFLSSLVPSQIISNQELLNCSKKIKSLQKISSFYLNALTIEDKKANSLVAAYKLELIKSSIEIYAYLEKNLEEIFKKNINGDKCISETEKKQIRQLLSQWKIELEAQKKELDPGLVNIGISITSSFISTLSWLTNSPLSNFIPSQLAIRITSATLNGLGVTLQFLRFIVLAIEIFVRTKQVRNVDNWTGDYRLWKKRNLSILTENESKIDLKISNNQLKNDVTKEKLNKMFNNLSLAEIKRKLRRVGIKLESNIKTKTDLKEKMASDHSFTESIENTYVNFHQQNAEFNQAIEDASNLYDKRLAVHDKKIFKVKHNFKEIQKTAFKDSVKKILMETLKDQPSQLVIDQELSKWKDLSNLTLNEKRAFLELLLNKKSQKEFFEDWFSTLTVSTKDKLISNYVNRQEVVESTLKGSIVEMISKKYKIEGVFSHFKLRSAKIYLGVGLAIFAATATLTAISLLAFPISGIGILLSLFTVASLLVSFWLVGKSFYLGFKYKPQVTRDDFKLLPIRTAYTEIRRNYEKYRHQSKMNKMLSSAIFLDSLELKFSGFIKEKKDLALYSQVSKDLHRKRMKIIDSTNRLKSWDERLEKLESEHRSSGWNDFSKQADLKLKRAGLDGLDRLIEALKEVDFHLLSKDTKYLLKVHLGIDIKSLEKEKRENPEKFEADIKKNFEKFASLTDFEFSKFITCQKTLIQKGLLKKT